MIDAKGRLDGAGDRCEGSRHPLEEETPGSLAATVVTKEKAFARRAAACRAATCGRPGRRPSDSAPVIRRERDAWG
jgi:hypothetical protein